MSKGGRGQGTKNLLTGEEREEEKAKRSENRQSKLDEVEKSAFECFSLSLLLLPWWNQDTSGVCDCNYCERRRRRRERERSTNTSQWTGAES